MKTIILSIIFVLLFSLHLSASEFLFLTHSLQGQTYFDKKGELRGKMPSINLKSQGNINYCINYIFYLKDHLEIKNIAQQ